MDSVGTLIQIRNRHINVNFLVWFDLGQTGNPGFPLMFDLYSGSPVSRRDEPSFSLGQTGVEGLQKRFQR